MLLYWVKITYRMTSCLTTERMRWILLGTFIHAGSAKMCSKRRTKWGGGGIRKKSTNYEKYSLVIVNQMRAFCNVINTSGGRRKVYQFNTQRSRNSPVSSNTSSNLDHVQIERLCGVLWKQNVLNKGPAEKRGEDDLSRPPILNREPNSRYQHLKRKKRWGVHPWDSGGSPPSYSFTPRNGWRQHHRNRSTWKTRKTDRVPSRRAAFLGNHYRKQHTRIV